MQALDEYLFDRSTNWDGNCTREYAAYMIDQIKK